MGEPCPICNTTTLNGPHTELDCLRYRNANLAGENGALQADVAQRNARIKELLRSMKMMRDACKAITCCRSSRDFEAAKSLASAALAIVEGDA